MSEKKKVYNGWIDELKGKSALTKPDPVHTDYVHAQFDDIELGTWAHGWHQFFCADFVDPSEYQPDVPKKLVIKMTQPKEWEPDEIKPELLKQRMRDW